MAANPIDDAVRDAAFHLIEVVRSIPETDLLALDSDPHPPSSLSVLANELESALTSAPPSVPVGVEATVDANTSVPDWLIPVRWEARRRNRYNGEWGDWINVDPTTEADVKAESVASEWDFRTLYALAQQPAACPKCGGTGEADSGGIMPWGAPAMIPCDCQQPADALGGVRELVARCRAEADAAYVAYIRKMDTDECRGWEAKVRAGTFARANLDAFTAAAELLSRSRALHAFASRLEAALAALEQEAGRG